MHPLSGKCSIYRVPETRGIYIQVITLKNDLNWPVSSWKGTAKSHGRAQKRIPNILSSTTKVRMASFFAFIKEREPKLRNSYAETIPLNCNELAKMVLVDAVLLIELFLRYFEPYLRTDDDRIIGKSNLYLEIRHDSLLLENRLPPFILNDLNDLFNVAKTATNQNDFVEKRTTNLELWLNMTCQSCVPRLEDMSVE